jgi:hypothetical protein
MLEWVCPRCHRSVDPGYVACPFCEWSPGAATQEDTESSAARARQRGRRPFIWADVERGFRFGLGFLAALAVGWFVLFVAAYVADNPEWIERLTRWLRLD